MNLNIYFASTTEVLGNLRKSPLPAPLLSLSGTMKSGQGDILCNADVPVNSEECLRRRRRGGSGSTRFGDRDSQPGLVSVVRGCHSYA